jgi:hypothetical protein
LRMQQSHPKRETARSRHGLANLGESNVRGPLIDPQPHQASQVA